MYISVKSKHKKNTYFLHKILKYVQYHDAKNCDPNDPKSDMIQNIIF